MKRPVAPTPQSRTRALLALCVLAAVTPAAADSAEIRYREAGGYAVVVPVYVQGVGPLDFLLDTGADATVVHPDLARRLGLKPVAQVELVTLAGSRLVPQARVASLSVGDTRLAAVDVLIHDMAAARTADPHLVGILGRDALRGTSFTIDHARRRVVIGAMPDSGDLPYVEVEGRPVLEARLPCQGDPVRLALDTGIGGIVLFEGSRPLPVFAPDTVTARTNGGSVALRAGRLQSLCLGAVRLADVAVAVGPESVPGRVEDGLLPTRLFRRVHFDAQRKTVRLEPW